MTDSSSTPVGNKAQQDELSRLNDAYGVASWKQQDDELIVVLDDGDEMVIWPDGSSELWVS